ncbi:MAG TPA: hypothetical protein VGL42_16530 [Opitutaceae bacterium]
MATGIAGTGDIVDAHVTFWIRTGRFPGAMMLKGIAGGALGKRAMEGGAGTAAMGLFFHFFISFAFTLLFFLLYPRVGALRKNRFAVGTAYALFTWAVMNYIVWPLSALPWRPPSFADWHLYMDWAVFTIVFGLPIVFCAARFYRRQQG